MASFYRYFGYHLRRSIWRSSFSDLAKNTMPKQLMRWSDNNTNKLCEAMFYWQVVNDNIYALAGAIARGLSLHKRSRLHFKRGSKEERASYVGYL